MSKVRPETNKVNVTYKISKEAHELLKAAAIAEDRNVTNMLDVLVKRYAPEVIRDGEFGPNKKNILNGGAAGELAA